MGKLEDEIEVGNPQQTHCATVLLLDTSGSMEGASILALNQALVGFWNDVRSNELASKRVDMAVVTFGDEVRVIHEFSSIDQFEPPQLTAEGKTAMGAGIETAIELIERRKRQYKDIGVAYYRPWLFLITDGEPTDMHPGDSAWASVVRHVHDGEAAKKFMFFAVGVESANMELLKAIAPAKRPPVHMQPGKWKELFQWVSNSQDGLLRSKPGDQVALPEVSGWGTVSA